MKHQLVWRSLACCLLVLGATNLCADQLAWNARGLCERAAAAIKPGSLLISYCSECDDERVEVWRVQDVAVGATENKELCEVRVSGRCLLRSMQRFDRGDYREPVRYETVAPGPEAAWSGHGIDLAYVYMPAGGNRFRCLGKALALDCQVRVETITLPEQALALATAATAAQPVPWTIPELCRRVPPLRHDAAGRFPMICIEPFRLAPGDRSFEEAKPLPADSIRELTRRGLTQWLPPLEKYIPFALALQEAGAKVIFMQGEAFNGPAGEVPDGLHKLPPDFQRDPEQPPQQPSYPCPLLFEGWRQRADALRATLRKFRDAGVKVDAAWLDWEIEPYAGESQWKEAKACSRCRTMFAPGILDDLGRYRAFITRLHRDLFSAYMVAPILEIYPTCSVTNWEVVVSSPECPTPNWGGRRVFPPIGLGLFTAANPVVYGNTLWYRYHWQAEWGWPLDAPHMDRVYTAVMLGEISKHEENARRYAPQAQSIPWVDRFCADDRDETIPILSRERYREILRHCWLRGADGMQVFNPNWFPDRPERAAIVTEEVEDAVAVYDEMLAFRPFLDAGEVMNTATFAAPYDGPVWSGLRCGDAAIVRCFTQAARSVELTFTPFADADPVTLACPPAGATYRLERQGKEVKASAVAVP